MKGARIRYQQTGEFHFLTFSCYRRRTYLKAAAARDLFEDALERVRQRYLFAVAGYVVMPEDVHLLINEPKRALLSKVIQALKLSVSMRGRERPFWQAHYYDFNVTAHEKFVGKLRYIHRNPVRRGLVAQPEDWRWSSFLHYQTGARGTVEIESDWTARERGWELPEWMRSTGADSSSSPVASGERKSASPVPKSEGPGHPRLNEIRVEIRALGRLISRNGERSSAWLKPCPFKATHVRRGGSWSPTLATKTETSRRWGTHDRGEQDRGEFQFPHLPPRRTRCGAPGRV